MRKVITSCLIRSYYEQGVLYHWEVLLNPEQIRPGVIACDEIAIFHEEHQARDFVRNLKAEYPDLAELAIVPSDCPQASPHGANE